MWTKLYVAQWCWTARWTDYMLPRVCLEAGRVETRSSLTELKLLSSKGRQGNYFLFPTDVKETIAAWNNATNYFFPTDAKETIAPWKNLSNELLFISNGLLFSNQRGLKNPVQRTTVFSPTERRSSSYGRFCVRFCFAHTFFQECLASMYTHAIPSNRMDHMWSYMDHIWSYMDHIWSHMTIYDHIWTITDHIWTMYDHMVHI